MAPDGTVTMTPWDRVSRVRTGWRVGAADKRQPPIQHMHLDLARPDGIVAQVIVTEMIEYAAPAAYPEYYAIVVHCGDAPDVLAEISPVPRLQ